MGGGHREDEVLRGIPFRMSQMHGASLVDTLPELWNMQIKGRGMMQGPSSLHFGSYNDFLYLRMKEGKCCLVLW